MFISEIKIDTYNIPLPEPVEAYAAGVMKSFDLVVCRITNDDEVEKPKQPSKLSFNSL